MVISLSLFIVAVFAYALGVVIDHNSYQTKDSERYQKPKLIPAEFVLMTIPINIGYMLDPNSAFGHIKNTSERSITLILLVIASLFTYTLLLSFGKKLHNRNKSEAFCVTNKDRYWLLSLYGIAGIFFIICVIIATY